MPILMIIRLIKNIFGFAEEETEMLSIGDDPIKLQNKLDKLEHEIENAKEYLSVQEKQGHSHEIRKAKKTLIHLEDQQAMYQNKFNHINEKQQKQKQNK